MSAGPAGVVAACIAALLAAVPAPAACAQSAAAAASPTLGDVYDALRAGGLAPETHATRASLRALVHAGEALAREGRHVEAVVLLHEATESPRFAGHARGALAAGARHALGRSLLALGAHRAAEGAAAALLARGVDDPWFAAGARLAVDVVLATTPRGPALARLEGRAPADGWPEEVAAELRYVQGRLHLDAADLDGARRALAAVGEVGRFGPSARYLLGVVEVRAGDLAAAEAHFCAVAELPEDGRAALLAGDRFFAVQDLARLALGRLAHEQGRAREAFGHYLRVPVDSPRLAEALFEGAWAMAEGGAHAVALDLLDQLEARAPHAAAHDEAALLRGYTHLARCEFAEAERVFADLERRLAEALAEADRALASPARLRALGAALASPGETAATSARSPSGPRTSERLLRAWLSLDAPTLRALDRVHALDAAAHRGRAAAVELEGLIAQRARAGDGAGAAPSHAPAADAGRAERLAAAGAQVHALAGQLDALRAEGVGAERLAPLEEALARASRALEEVSARAAAGTPAETPVGPGAEGDPVSALLAREAAVAAALEARADALHARLRAAADAALRGALERARERLVRAGRRARLGRVDAVMGDKRRLEQEVASLAAGRAPPVRVAPPTGRLLRDDEEYWPLDGERWDDEPERRLAPGAGSPPR